MQGRSDIRQAHQPGRQMILNRALDEGALEIKLSAAGVPQIVLGDFATMRSSFGAFWKDIQRARQRRMTKAQQKWARALTAAQERLQTPKYTIYLNPHLVPLYDERGNIRDVVLHYVIGTCYFSCDPPGCRKSSRYLFTGANQLFQNRSGAWE